MSCPPFDVRDYVLGELTPSQREQMQAHLEHCPACAADADTLSLTRTALLSVREEEPPRRIAFVSDKVFQPRWWQLWFRPSFAGALLIALAILAHALYRPVQKAQQAPVAQVQSLSPQQVEQLVRDAVAQAVAQSEARLNTRWQKVLAERDRQLELQRRGDLVAMQQYAEYLQNGARAILRASLSDIRPEVTQ
jgi:anti-sigma factor RsiW